MTTEQQRGNLGFRTWRQVGQDLREALGRVGALGVAWKTTRFDHYLQLIDEHGEMSKEELLARPATTETWEALRQADQLRQAAGLFDGVPREILIPKLEIVVSGPNVHVDPDKADQPRNTLFELMVGRLLHDLGFGVTLTHEVEDLILTHPLLPERISVECKRPAYCSTPDEIQGRLLRNLVKLRDQLKSRDRRNIGMGVVAMDGLYRMRDYIAKAADRAAIVRMVQNALSEAVDDILSMNRARGLKLESGMQIGAVVLLGMGQDADARGYALQFLRAFLLGKNVRLKKALTQIVGAPWPP